MIKDPISMLGRWLDLTGDWLWRKTWTAAERRIWLEGATEQRLWVRAWWAAKMLVVRGLLPWVARMLLVFAGLVVVVWLSIYLLGGVS